MGIGWNVLASLQRVAMGFGLAALVGIPAGFLIGRFRFIASMLNPIICFTATGQPAGLAANRSAAVSARRTGIRLDHFICSIWPMVINTAEGVTAHSAGLSQRGAGAQTLEFTVMRKILFPAVLPHILTGVRLSIGIAWLVIVAAEMLTGGVGIGFWIWNEWNNLNVENIIIAIVIIGVVGLLLEQGLMLHRAALQLRKPLGA